MNTKKCISIVGENYNFINNKFFFFKLETMELNYQWGTRSGSKASDVPLTIPNAHESRSTGKTENL